MWDPQKSWVVERSRDTLLIVQLQQEHYRPYIIVDVACLALRQARIVVGGLFGSSLFGAWHDQ